MELTSAITTNLIYLYHVKRRTETAKVGEHIIVTIELSPKEISSITIKKVTMIVNKIYIQYSFRQALPLKFT